MKPMTVKQLKALLDKAPENALIWFDNWEDGENGETVMYHHPVNFAQIKYSTDSFDVIESFVKLSCVEAEEWDENEEQGAPIDMAALTPEQFAIVEKEWQDHGQSKEFDHMYGHLRKTSAGPVFIKKVIKWSELEG